MARTFRPWGPGAQSHAAHPWPLISLSRCLRPHAVSSALSRRPRRATVPCRGCTRGYIMTSHRAAARRSPNGKCSPSVPGDARGGQHVVAGGENQRATSASVGVAIASCQAPAQVIATTNDSTHRRSAVINGRVSPPCDETENAAGGRPCRHVVTLRTRRDCPHRTRSSSTTRTALRRSATAQMPDKSRTAPHRAAPTRRGSDTEDSRAR